MVQAANFRAKTGHTKRPITKLCQLKVSAKETKQDKQSDSNGETDRPIATTGLIMRRSEPNSTKENRSLESEEQLTFIVRSVVTRNYVTILYTRVGRGLTSSTLHTSEKYNRDL